jgi:hypothetical protein
MATTTRAAGALPALAESLIRVSGPPEKIEPAATAADSARDWWSEQEVGDEYVGERGGSDGFCIWSCYGGERSIFAAIETHKLKNRELHEAFAAYSVDEDPSDDVQQKFLAIEGSARWDLCTTVPTTPAGLCALIRYVVDVRERKYRRNGRADTAFCEDDLWNIMTSACDHLENSLEMACPVTLSA